MTSELSVYFSVHHSLVFIFLFTLPIHLCLFFCSHCPFTCVFFFCSHSPFTCLYIALYEVCPESVQPYNILRKIASVAQWGLSPTMRYSVWNFTLLSQCLVHFLKQNANSSFGISVSCFISFTVLILLPFSGDFSIRKSQKSGGAVSGLYGG